MSGVTFVAIFPILMSHIPDYSPDSPHLASVVSSSGKPIDTPLVQCTSHMCPIRVHWHVKLNYKEYWRIKVTITNLILGNLKSIETSACGTVDASVHAYQQREVHNVWLMMLRRTLTPQNRVKLRFQ